MKIKYFEDTDTLHITFREDVVVESRELDENTMLDLDDQGRVCGITLEHAGERTDVHQLVVEGMAA